MTISLKDSTLLQGRLLINGEWVDADNNETLDIINPSTGEVVASVAKAGTDETKRAIEAANQALPAWRAKSAKERASLLKKLFDLMIENQDDLGAILTAEQGKPLAEAKGEIAYSASFLEWFAEEGKRLYGDIIPAASGDKRLLTIKQGIGVVGAITPWNFPSAMLGRKLGPALAAGCTVVCKPANATPLSAYAIGVLAQRAGFPAGVINIVTGRTSQIGDELTSNPIVKKITFTGSTPVGKHLMAQCAATVKRTSMELGGNAPFIVFDDADLDAAVAGAIASKYRNAGQTCVCANRLFVHDAVYATFIEKFKKAVAELKVGDGFDSQTTVGPLVDERAAQSSYSFIDDAVAQGANIELGGTDAAMGACFLEPTILTNVNRNMRVFKEEIFGPIAPVFSFSSDQEVIELANDSEFGLASYFYSRDIGRIWRIAEALDYGIVGINEGIISTEVAPFGGVKESGNGREGSKYGLDDYTEIKYLCMGGI